MKFRAISNDYVAMKDLMNTANSISKLAKEGVMRLSQRKVYFIIFDDEISSRNPLVWCELPVNFYFSSYTLDGISVEYNEIYLAFKTVMLSKALSTLKQNAKSLKMKLTDKQSPCITLEIEQNQNEGVENRLLIHDVPVEVISKKHWSNYEEPKFTNFHHSLQVSIQMPNLRLLKNIVERMKNMNNSIIVAANKFGRLTFKIKTNIVTLSAHFLDLEVNSFSVENAQADEDEFECQESENSVTATVDLKKFLMYLSGMHPNNYKTTCSIVNNTMIKLVLDQPGALSFQFFLCQLSS